MINLQLKQTLTATCKGCYHNETSPCPGSDICLKWETDEYYIFVKPHFFLRIWNYITEITPLSNEQLSDPDFNQGKNRHLTNK